LHILNCYICTYMLSRDFAIIHICNYSVQNICKYSKFNFALVSLSDMAG
jgi:hypothetical protein